MRKMISILVRNHPGVLSHVAGMFTRRAYNIESIAAGPTENPAVTRITIVASGNEVILEQVTKQLRKLVDVIKVLDLRYSESIVRELVLLTLFVPKERRHKSIEQIKAEIRKVTADIPGVNIQINAPLQHRIDHVVTGIRSAIAVKIFGENLNSLTELADQVQQMMATVPGVTDLQIEQISGVPQLQIKFDQFEEM